MQFRISGSSELSITVRVPRYILKLFVTPILVTPLRVLLATVMKY